MAKEKKFKPRKSSADTLVTSILVVVILAVLGLAVYAVGSKIAPKIEEQRIAAEQAAEQEKAQTFTVQDAADEKGLSLDEFKEAYGLKDANAEDLMASVEGNMTCQKYAEYKDMTFEEVAEENQFPETVTPEMTMTEAYDLVPISVTLGGEESFNEMKTQLGLGDEVTADMPSGEAMPIINQKYSEMMLAQQAAQEATEGEAAEGEAVAEEAAEEPAEEAPAEEATEEAAE